MVTTRKYQNLSGSREPKMGTILGVAREFAPLGRLETPRRAIWSSLQVKNVRRLQDVGTATVMPLGSPIGSNRGLETRAQIEIIIRQAAVPW
jgi:hypothetical protein